MSPSPSVSCVYQLAVVYFFCLLLQDLYCVRSDLGNLLKALGRLEEAKVCLNMSALARLHNDFCFKIIAVDHKPPVRHLAILVLWE